MIFDDGLPTNEAVLYEGYLRECKMRKDRLMATIIPGIRKAMQILTPEWNGDLEGMAKKQAEAMVHRLIDAGEIEPVQLPFGLNHLRK